MITVELFLFSLCVLWTGNESHCDGDTRAYKECARYFGDKTHAHEHRSTEGWINPRLYEVCIPKPCRELYPRMTPSMDPLVSTFDISALEACATRVLAQQSLFGDIVDPRTYDRCLNPMIPFSLLEPNPPMDPITGRVCQLIDVCPDETIPVYYRPGECVSKGGIATWECEGGGALINPPAWPLVFSYPMGATGPCGPG